MDSEVPEAEEVVAPAMAVAMVEAVEVVMAEATVVDSEVALEVDPVEE